MAHKERLRFIGAFHFVVGKLLFSLAIIGVAVAQNPVPPMQSHQARAAG